MSTSIEKVDRGSFATRRNLYYAMWSYATVLKGCGDGSCMAIGITRIRAPSPAVAAFGAMSAADRCTCEPFDPSWLRWAAGVAIIVKRSTGEGRSSTVTVADVGRKPAKTILLAMNHDGPTRAKAGFLRPVDISLIWVGDVD